MPDWRDDHADEASKSIEHELVEDVIEEFMDNIGLKDKGLPAYGIRKVALYAAQVARADALGFDPNLLRSTEDEIKKDKREIADQTGIFIHLMREE